MYLSRQGGCHSQTERIFPTFCCQKKKSGNDSSSLPPRDRDGTNSRLTACRKSNERVTLDASRGRGRGDLGEERLGFSGSFLANNFWFSRAVQRVAKIKTVLTWLWVQWTPSQTKCHRDNWTTNPATNLNTVSFSKPGHRKYRNEKKTWWELILI